MKVIWKDIRGYKGIYQVSNDGRVRTVEHITNGRHVKPKELKVTILKCNRYARVRLYKQGKYRDYMVHRLVANEFVPNPDNKPQVNHIDGNRGNNNANNLEWCTQAENNRHAIDIGLQNPSVMLTATRKKVLQLTLDGQVVREWRSMSEAARENRLEVSNISHCCKGRIKSTGGYRWRLASEL